MYAFHPIPKLHIWTILKTVYFWDLKHSEFIFQKSCLIVIYAVHW